MSRAPKGRRPDVIPELRSHYEQFTAAHPLAAVEIGAALAGLLADAGVSYDRVTCRVKEWRSYRAKAVKRSGSGEWAYPDPWQDIQDLVGARVTTFHSTAIPAVAEVLGDALDVLRVEDKTAETRVAGQFGYGSHHLIARVPQPPAEVPEGLEDYAGLVIEVQLRTVLQHAWAEFEHDIRYKAHPGRTSDPRIDRAFTLAAGLIELADQQFDQIAAIMGRDTADTDLPATVDDVDPVAEDLPGMLTLMLGPSFPRSKAQAYEWLDQLLDADGVTTVAQLKEITAPARVEAVTGAIRYRFTPGHARILDDLLLCAFGQSHIRNTGQIGDQPERRPGVLANRWALMQQAGITEAP